MMGTIVIHSDPSDPERRRRLWVDGVQAFAVFLVVGFFATVFFAVVFLVAFFLMVVVCLAVLWAEVRLDVPFFTEDFFGMVGCGVCGVGDRIGGS
jgi:hypothetical protein